MPTYETAVVVVVVAQEGLLVWDLAAQAPAAEEGQEKEHAALQKIVASVCVTSSRALCRFNISSASRKEPLQVA
jgi:hypothetical protein